MDRTKWVCRKFKEVSTVIGGSTPKTDKSEYWGGSHYWVTPAELDGSKYISKTERSLTDKAVSETNLTLLPTGTVLLSSRAPIGKVCITQSPMYCNQGFKNIVCSDLLYNEFVYYYLLHNVDYLQSLGTGATFKEISKKVVENVEIIVPSLSDQQRIVAELDKLNELIALKRKQLADLDSLAQSLFYEMFGDPVVNEQGWEVKKLDTLCTHIVDCPHSTPKKVDKITPYPCIRTSELKGGNISWDTMQYLEKDEYDVRIARLKPEAGDIVFGREGTIGDAVILPKGYFFSLGQRTMLLRTNESMVTNTFLHRVILSEWVKKQIRFVNVSSTVAHVNIKDFKLFDIPLPPLPLQKSFATKIAKIEAEKQRVKSSLKDLETLLASRMQYWFDN